MELSLLGTLGAIDSGMMVQYLFVLLMLVAMEGLLSADNALVLAVMVRPLAPNLRQKALFYGLVGAVVLRFVALFFVSFLVNIWQAQAIGAVYLIYVGLHNIYKYQKAKKETGQESSKEQLPEEVNTNYLYSKKEFWKVVAKVEITDIAFAVDSILAAVALAISLPETGWGHIGGMDTGQFVVVLIGGLCGVVLMRFAATIFVKLLDKRPKLEMAAFLLVTWVGVKLVVVTLAHEKLGILPHEFPESTLWQVIFYGVMLLIALWGWFASKPKDEETSQQ
ncbi:MAG: TerC family protein [Peptococcaceae bacterium]|nr:TerC family protein [Peptococcaceae bacterium]